MKKYILLLGWFFFAFSCNIQQRGSSEISESVSISKKEGLFITEFNVIGDTVRNPDAIDIVIEEAWLEKLWYYEPKFFHDKIRVVNGAYQIVLKINDFKNDYDYSKTWLIKLKDKQLPIDAETNGIAIRNVDLHIDTLSIEIFKYKTTSFKKQKDEGEKIGEYILVPRSRTITFGENTSLSCIVW